MPTKTTYLQAFYTSVDVNDHIGGGNCVKIKC